LNFHTHNYQTEVNVWPIGIIPSNLITMAATPGLFSSSLISAEVKASLPAGYIVRALEKEDFAKGYLDCLRVLTHVGDLSVEQFNERYEEMEALKGTYYLLVMEHEKRIVATASLIVEKKL
jgi:glucosamine-phosphate N-acetyltransferase